MTSNETIAINVGPSHIDVAYQQIGDASSPTVLLIQGLGTQLLGWPDGFCQALVDHGLRLIRFDNRDVGRSTHFTNAPAPDLPAVLGGDYSSVSYTLSDMAADAVGLLDVLGIGSAHVVGASLGGAIAQTMAIEHPARVRSLVSMMSSTGDMKVGQSRPGISKQLFEGPPPATRQEVIDRHLKALSVIGSPGFPIDRNAVAERVGRAFDRGYDPQGMARQAIASLASTDRTPQLNQLDVPALVVHGCEDAMCDCSGGLATAAAIHKSKLVLVKGLGHDLPPGAWPEITGHIAALVQHAESRIVAPAGDPG
jgi:pimeloyl-ACP methyl ester carboxylesterase